jgi:hypothetical protein
MSLDGTNFPRYVECVRNPGQPSCPNLDFADKTLFVFPPGGDPSKPWLTSNGCTSLCGCGFQLWGAEDSAATFTLWLVPAIIQIAHFLVLGIRNTYSVIVELLGNPINNMWAILTRREVNRRLYQRAVAGKLGEQSGKDVAAVAAACDEFG